VGTPDYQSPRKGNQGAKAEREEWQKPLSGTKLCRQRKEMEARSSSRDYMGWDPQAMGKLG